MHELLIHIMLLAILLGFWWLLFYSQRNYWESHTRQKLFEIRDRLFDSASEGKLEFDSHAYSMTRTTINGMIRFTHRMSIGKFVAMIFVSKKLRDRGYISKYQKQFDDALNELPIESKKIILSTLADAHLEMVSFMISCSPILFPILKPVVTLIRLAKKTKQVRRKLLRGPKNKGPWSIFDEATYEFAHKETH